MSDSEAVSERTVSEPVPAASGEQSSQGAVLISGPAPSSDFALERYKFILQQIHTINENLYRFLAIYQALATTMVGAALALYVGYQKWGIASRTARDGVIGLLALTTMVAGFTITLIVVGAFSWLDYRNEESELTDEFVRPNFRARPHAMNFIRWYESYAVAFIVASVFAVWLLAVFLVLPAMH